jgi:predicted transcriptional regulator
MIREKQPGSISELAEMAGRDINPFSAACCGKSRKFGVVLCETITISTSVL